MKVESLSSYDGGFNFDVRHDGVSIGMVRFWHGQVSYFPLPPSDKILKWRQWINTVEQLENFLESNASEILAVSK